MAIVGPPTTVPVFWVSDSCVPRPLDLLQSTLPLTSV